MEPQKRISIRSDVITKLLLNHKDYKIHKPKSMKPENLAYLKQWKENNTDIKAIQHNNKLRKTIWQEYKVEKPKGKKKKDLSSKNGSV
tara:strand:- start:138 stop:401 length:264 start_codon:yes stop_codon:yes gene_type:complete